MHKNIHTLSDNSIYACHIDKDDVIIIRLRLKCFFLLIHGRSPRTDSYSTALPTTL